MGKSTWQYPQPLTEDVGVVLMPEEFEYGAAYNIVSSFEGTVCWGEKKFRNHTCEGYWLRNGHHQLHQNEDNK